MLSISRAVRQVTDAAKKLGRAAQSAVKLGGKRKSPAATKKNKKKRKAAPKRK